MEVTTEVLINTGVDLHPVHQVYDGKFNTASGKVINLLHPHPDTIDLADIAAALSKICRFGGHTQRFYSVAQHSLLVAQLVPKSIYKEALLHDAAEAYLGDVIKPLKVFLSAYDRIEKNFMETIINKYGLSVDNLEAVKEYDMKACELEHEHLQKGMAGNYPWVLEKIWQPQQAETAFLDWCKPLL